MQKFIAAALAVIALSGCATDIMSEKQCLAGDWYAAGLEDGVEGRLETALDARAGRCAQFGAAVDDRAYFDGRRAGLDQLCNPRGGYDYGRAGKSYVGVCGAEWEEDFLGGYLDGQRTFVAQSARDGAQTAYNGAVSTVNTYRENIRRARRVLSDEDATEKEIARARKDLDNARDSLPYAERLVDDRLYELGRADEALAQTLASASSWRTSAEFESIRATLMEAHDFARANPAIDFCTDDFAGFTPRCELSHGGQLADSVTGALCALGPGEARFVRRSQRREGGRPAGAAHAYDFYPRDPANGRISRRPEGAFDVFFGRDGLYEGLACTPFPSALAPAAP